MSLEVIRDGAMCLQQQLDPELLAQAMGACNFSLTISRRSSGFSACPKAVRAVRRRR